MRINIPSTSKCISTLCIRFMDREMDKINMKKKQELYINH